MRYSIILFVLLAVFSCKNQGEEEVTSMTKPNVIFIISDDQAYGDYGFMGHEKIETPHIDRLANESLTFTRGYVTSPVCSPSLASIITGLYTHQHGMTGNDPLVEYEGPKRFVEAIKEGELPPNSFPVKRSIAYKSLAENYYRNKLITQTLSENGYRSFQSGKWWIGSAEDAGFDQGMTHGDYTRGGRHGDEGLKIGREGLDPIFDFIGDTTAQEKPFFIWYAPFLPHTPHNPPKELEEKYLKIAPSPYIAKYWAMIEWFDQTVGELLNHLEEKGLDENTIIVYTCDNGWIQSIDGKGYAPRSKRSPYEGGIRTPISFKYPNVIKPMIDKDHLVSNIDLVPTVLALLGLEEDTLPGINVMNNRELKSRKSIFSEAYNHDILDIKAPTKSLLYQVVIEDKWKLILPNKEMIKKNATSQKERIAGYYSADTELYNLEDDPSESVNLAEKRPEIVKQLANSIKAWRAQN